MRPQALKRVPWNIGKVTGAKPPLRPKHVWSIRTKLQIEGRARDLAMFNLAIDSLWLEQKIKARDAAKTTELHLNYRTDLPDGQISELAVQPHLQKYFA
jgi:hypothetical protein